MPVGRDDAFCKHCVAVGLAWLEQGRAVGHSFEQAKELVDAVVVPLLFPSG